MSLEMLRNVKTGEVREVETNSDEYFELINEKYDHDGSARPKYEITGAHHVRRLDEGDIGETDHGEEDKPVPPTVVDASEIVTDHPERYLTEAEVEAGIKDYDQKAKDLGLQPLDEATDVEPLDRGKATKRSERAQSRVGRSGKSRKTKRPSGGSSGSSSGSGSGSSGSSGSGPSTASGSGGSASGGGSSS